MSKTLQTIIIFLFSLQLAESQDCNIVSVDATALNCAGDSFNILIDLEVDNPASPGFVLAGNGTVYGTFLYQDLPIIIGPFLGDDLTVYEFIAWDAENPDCQNYTTVPAANCGPICSITNAELTFLGCQAPNAALIEFDFTPVNPTSLTFDLFYENGDPVSSGEFLYASLPITVQFFQVSGAAPIVLTVCDHVDDDCCTTFTFDPIDCDTTNCEIFNPIVDPECTGNNFLVHLDFGYDEVASDSFTVNGNNINYGTHAYNELPITLGPLNGGTSINWEFIIADQINQSCRDTAILGIYNCPPPCVIDSLGAQALLCNGDDFYMLQLGMEIEGEGDSGFSVFSETDFYGSFSYDSIPLTIEDFEVIPGQIADQITVCDNENQQCCATTTFETLLCNTCIIYNLTADVIPCNEENEFFVVLNFNHQNNSDLFEVTGNMMSYGTFSYEDLPLELGPFPGDGSIHLEFVLTDVNDPLCFASIELGEVFCNEICEISNLTVETGACTGENQYVATINFDHQADGGLGFDLWINGEFYAFYNYNLLPLTILNFPSDGIGNDFIQVCDNDDPTCCAVLEFDAPECVCGIFDLSADVMECTSDSTFAVAIHYTSENTPNNNIDVYFNDQYLGFFNGENLPVIVSNVPEGDGTGVITVCASDQNDCCDEVVVELIFCEDPSCNINELLTETGDCTSDSTYVLDFTFNHHNLPTDSIIVTANGTYIGTYIIDPEYNRIENFPVLENDTVHFVICAVGDPECCEDRTYIAPDCSLFGQCNIWDLVAIVGDCQSDTSFVLHIEFNYQELPTDSVDISVNGNYYGTFQVHEGSIFLEHFPINPGETGTITVCATGAPDCCDTAEFENPGCNDCHITDLAAIVGDCESDSTYQLHIEFNFNNLPTDSVILIANGNNLGTHHVNEGNFFLNGFPVYESNHTTLYVCAQEAPDCCDVIEFETPNCEGGGACNINDLIADATECQSDTDYILFLHYIALNFPGDSINVFANGNYIGTFLHNPEGIYIEHFPVYDTEFTHILVCATSAPDCCEDVNLVTPDCGPGGCNIVDLFGVIGDCLTDSTYVLTLNFEYNDLGTDSVHITVNDESFGNFFINEGHIILEHLADRPPLFTVVEVCALGNEDCCDVIEFETPDCEGGGTCHIVDLVADPGECTSDSTFNLFINYFSNNTPEDSIIVTANDQYVGTFPDLPGGFTIENFPHLPGEVTHLTVCAVGAPDCCDTYEFETPFCTDECIIYNVEVQVFDCNSDSTFGAVVHFDYQNIDAGGFDIWAGDQYLGFFTIDEEPVEIGHFPSNETGHYLVTICESDNLECCTTAEFNGPVCGEEECHIFDLTWEMTECDSNGQFYFILDFEFENVGDDGFNIIGNGNNYGNFSYENLPVTIGPFEDTGLNFEFAVFDADHVTCNDVINPGDVDCGVAVIPVDPLEYFEVFNNGTIPGILARKNISISLFNANGKLILSNKDLSTQSYYELSTMADGFYLMVVRSEDKRWPVKLVRVGR